MSKKALPYCDLKKLDSLIIPHKKNTGQLIFQ
jgi:hypothetical protein